MIGYLFIGVGIAALLYHLFNGPLDRWVMIIGALEIIAIVGGVFLLKGRNWARWLMLVWVAFHVGVSAFHSVSAAAAHLVLLVAIGYFLLTPPDSRYFRSVNTE